MKNQVSLSSLILVVCVVISSFATTSDTILERIGVEETTAKNSIESYIFDDRFWIPKVSMLADIMSGDKVGAAEELAVYVKSYTMSPEFKQKYNELRQSRKPTFEPEPTSVETIEMLKSSANQIKEMFADPDMASNLPKEMKDAMQKSLDEIYQQIKEAEDKTPNKTKWEKSYPEDVNVFIRSRLEEYLKLSASVDFNAQLTTNQYNKKVFVNTTYEYKDAKWKACFRAGKEVNDKIRQFAQKWLKEL